MHIVEALRRIMLPQLGRRLHPAFLVLRRLRDTFEHPLPIEPAAGDRVLVLAPHSDDEAIGCGGAVLRHRAAGGSVAVVYVTDGAEGDARLATLPHGSAEAVALRRELVRTRRAEGQAWCRAADVQRVDFLDAPDGRLGAIDLQPLAARLAALLDALRPTLLYLPSPVDRHPDHRATNALALAAIRASGAPPPRLRGYEVWTPLPANAVMDISDVAATKARLLKLHASQIRDIDYGHHIIGLNAYRSILLPARRGHAEAFVDLPFERYAELLAR